MFLDETNQNCQPIQAALDSLKIKYVRHSAYFKPGALDEEWLSVVGRNRWAVLTCDKRIRYNQLERDKVLQHGIREFVFSSGNLSGPMMGEILKIAGRKMESLFSEYPPPFIAYISQSGNVAVRYDKGGSVHARTKSV